MSSLPSDDDDATAADIKRIPRDKWPKAKPKLTAKDVEHIVAKQEPQPRLGEDLDRWDRENQEAKRDRHQVKRDRQIGGAIVPLGTFDGLDLEPIKPELVVKGMLYKDSLVTFVGQAKVGKTWIMLDMALAFANGIPWMGFEPEKPMTIAYLDGEMPVWALLERSQVIAKARGVSVKGTDQGGVFFYPFHDHQPKVTLTDIKNAAYTIKEIRPDLVIVDNLSAFHDSDAAWFTSESDDKSMDIIATTWKDIRREFGCPMILVHHATKGTQHEKGIMDMGSGSGALGRRTDGQMVIREMRDQDGESIRTYWQFAVKLRHFYPDKEFEIWRNGSVFDVRMFGSDDLFPIEDQAEDGQPPSTGHPDGAGKAKACADISESTARQLLFHEFAEKPKGLSRRMILDVLKCGNGLDLFNHWKSSSQLVENHRRGNSVLYTPAEGFFDVRK